MQSVVPVVELCDLLMLLYVSDKNPLAPTHKRDYVKERNEYGTVHHHRPRSLDRSREH